MARTKQSALALSKGKAVRKHVKPEKSKKEKPKKEKSKKEKSPKSKTCACTTAKGSKCKRSVKSGSKYCFQHRK